MLRDVTDDEWGMILSARAAHLQLRRDSERTYQFLKRQYETDGLVEVERGHWVRPGESWEDEAGVIHRNAISPPDKAPSP